MLILRCSVTATRYSMCLFVEETDGRWPQRWKLASLVACLGHGTTQVLVATDQRRGLSLIHI